MTPEQLRAFADEMAKIAMARVGLEPGAHVATRLVQRGGLAQRAALKFERAVHNALQSAGGRNLNLGRGDFHVPINVGGTPRGTFVLTDLRGPGHRIDTFLSPGMTHSGRSLGESALNKEQRNILKKAINEAKKQAWPAG